MKFFNHELESGFVTYGVTIPVGNDRVVSVAVNSRGRWKVNHLKRRLGLNMKTPETVFELIAESLAIHQACRRRRLVRSLLASRRSYV